MRMHPRPASDVLTPNEAPSGVPGRVLGKPFSDGWHAFFEAPWDGEIQRARPLRGSILEIMSRARWHEHERAPGRIDPAIVDQKAHRSLDDVEDVVFVVRMRSRSLRVGLEPPLGDGIGISGFPSVRLEEGADAP